ncbi:ubiquinol-cytochrome-c reductase complex assembly factor 1-like [Ruditapes philippinarum]|uniref:ubiquinol-cytochrome-c reductase complex assembly factor 1-like n=1 Tax=Ruditapes philippinarum TaxID=129788 RepID=UPI00295BE4B7|nr:ubiquinol-cytochrome-c reductase complex assembly factor 1-like [Ruditapes philippinarum]
MMMRGKLLLYKALRFSGVRLYSSKSRPAIRGRTPCSNHACCSNILRENYCSNILREDDSILKRDYSTPKKEEFIKNVGFFTRFKENLGFKGTLRYYPMTLKYSGFRLYLSAAEASRYNNIYDYIDLPDTMASWHKLTCLHVWLIMVRVSTEGREGRILRDQVIENLITDTKAKARMLGKELDIRVQAGDLDLLHTEFLAALGNYDEGLLLDDKVLAASLWRSLFTFRQDIDPRHLEIMVQYVRKQVQFLQKMQSKFILANGLIPFLPIEGDIVPQSTKDRLKSLSEAKLQHYTTRG